MEPQQGHGGGQRQCPGGGRGGAQPGHLDTVGTTRGRGGRWRQDLGLRCWRTARSPAAR